MCWGGGLALDGHGAGAGRGDRRHVDGDSVGRVVVVRLVGEERRARIRGALHHPTVVPMTTMTITLSMILVMVKVKMAVFNVLPVL